MDMPARSGGVAIAYQVVGDSEQTLVFGPPLTSLYSLWQMPRVDSFLPRLGQVFAYG
jgi:hypothetical protein